MIKMCQGYVEFYLNCPHSTAPKLSEPCEAGWSDENCAAGRLVVSIRGVRPSPRWCPDCYRGIEKSICDQHDVLVANIRREKTKLEEDWGDDEAEDIQLWLRHQSQRLDAAILDVQGRKQTALRGFREENSVWGDG